MEYTVAQILDVGESTWTDEELMGGGVRREDTEH